MSVETESLLTKEVTSLLVAIESEPARSLEASPSIAAPEIAAPGSLTTEAKSQGLSEARERVEGDQAESRQLNPEESRRDCAEDDPEESRGLSSRRECVEGDLEDSAPVVTIVTDLPMTPYILKDYGQFDLTRLRYSATPNERGVWTVRYEGTEALRQRLLIRTPVMSLSNLTLTARGGSLDLAWPSLESCAPEQRGPLRQFHDLINIVDIHHITDISDAPERFHLPSDQSMAEVEAQFLPAIRKSGYTFDDCLKFLFAANEPIKIFDQEGAKIENLDLLQDYWRQAPGRRLSATALCCLEGIKRQGDYFQTEWQLWQLKVKR